MRKIALIFKGSIPMVAVTILVACGGNGSGSAISVPNVAGEPQAAASTAITGAGLTVGTVTTQSSSTVTSGDVISENPVASTRVDGGTAVGLVISSGPAPAVVISGTVAAGMALTGTVSVYDSSANAQPRSSGGTIGSGGQYSVTVTGFTAPFLIQASGQVGGQGPTVTLYSVATAGGTVNLTPITTLMALNMAAGNLQSLMTGSAGSLPALTAADLSDQNTNMDTLLSSVLTAEGLSTTYNFSATTFTTGSVGYDKLLDNVTINSATATAVTVTNNTDTAAPITIDTAKGTPGGALDITSGPATLPVGTINTYNVGGTLSGLTASGLVLQDNAGDNLDVPANATTFTFATALDSGKNYAITVLTQPPGQVCTVASGSGTVSANVTSVAVACIATTYSIGGTISGLGTGLSVVLQDNGGDNLTVSANGSFTFPSKVASAGAYAVTVMTQPTGQTCTVASGSGTVSANVSGVAVTCTIAYTVSANVTGLGADLSVTLQDNGADNKSVTASGAALFATVVANGKPYAVTVLTQPTNQTCTPSQGSGTVAGANVTVGVNCVYNSSDASLNGSYTSVFYEINNGAANGSVPESTVGTEDFSGTGGYTLPTATVNTNGNILSNVPVNLSGTYEVSPNGTSVSNSVITGGVIGQNDNAYIDADLTAGDQPLMGIAVKPGSGLSTASAAGNFTLVGLQYASTSANGFLATVTFDNMGNATGTSIRNDSGVISSGPGDFNPVTIAANGALTDTGGGIGALSADTNFAVSGDFKSGDAPRVIVGVRTGSAMTTSAVSGQYTGVDYNGQVAGGFAGASAIVPSLLLDGQGNFSGSVAGNTAGTITPSTVGGGTYTVQANGTMTLQGADGGGSYQGAVSVDGNIIVLANLTSNNAPEIIVLFRQ